MDEVAPTRGERGASLEQLDQLLARLDPNRETAGEKYEHLRRKLMKFFEWNHCYPSDDLADETLDRTARKLEEVEDVGHFAFGVARKIRLEAYERMQRIQQPDDDPIGERGPAPVVQFSEAAMLDKIDHQRRMRCLERCMERLSPKEREWIIEYYDPEGEPHAQWRQWLAEKLEVSGGTLRTRMNRLRDRLEVCVTRCLQSTAATVSPTNPRMRQQ